MEPKAARLCVILHLCAGRSFHIDVSDSESDTSEDEEDAAELQSAAYQEAHLKFAEEVMAASYGALTRTRGTAYFPKNLQSYKMGVRDGKKHDLNARARLPDVKRARNV